DPESRYHSNELEVTAEVWAITDRFRLYLLGRSFTLLTDNYTTAYVVAKAKTNRKFARYIVELAAFDFEVCHRPGKENIVADTLSRNPLSCFTVIASALEIIDAQLRDPFCAVMKTKLNQPP